LLARSLGAANATLGEPPAVFGIALRFACLFVLDILIYARFAWAPQVSRCEARTDRQGEKGDAGLEALVAELRRENAALRLKAYA
jgi:hypothetical protein